MRTVSIFKNGKNQAVRLPKDMEYQDVTDLEIIKKGNTIILRPARPDWLSLTEYQHANPDFCKSAMMSSARMDDFRYEDLYVRYLHLLYHYARNAYIRT